MAACLVTCKHRKENRTLGEFDLVSGIIQLAIMETYMIYLAAAWNGRNNIMEKGWKIVSPPTAALFLVP